MCPAGDCSAATARPRPEPAPVTSIRTPFTELPMIEAVDRVRVRAEDGVTFGLGQLRDQLFRRADDLHVRPCE